MSRQSRWSAWPTQADSRADAGAINSRRWPTRSVSAASATAPIGRTLSLLVFVGSELAGLGPILALDIREDDDRRFGRRVRDVRDGLGDGARQFLLLGMGASGEHLYPY